MFSLHNHPITYIRLELLVQYQFKSLRKAYPILPSLWSHWSYWDHTASKRQNRVLKADLLSQNVDPCSVAEWFTLRPISYPYDVLASLSLQPSSKPTQLLFLEIASKKLIQWINMRAILELPFNCWNGYRFIEANSGWYLGTGNYLHLLYPRLLQLNIYCPEFCPFQWILNKSMPQATKWHNSFGAIINLRLPLEMMQKKLMEHEIK